MSEENPLVSAPASTDRAQIEPLGYFESHDAMVNKDYAYAVYKETNPANEKWYLKIKATCTAGTSLDPDHPSVRKNISEAAKAGKDYIVFGFNLVPKGDDPRLVENRMYFDENLNPTKVSMHLITRNADGSPTPEQTINFDWPGEIKEQPQLLTPPKSTDRIKYTELAYMNSYDVITDKDYAYLAYKEERTDTGNWMLRITAKSTAGGSIDPNHALFKKNLDEAAAKGLNYMKFGFNLEPKGEDPRLVENRLYFDDSKNPTHIEMHVITRKADGSPTEKKVAKFDWPA
jgi:hypothetical protein